ncbi:MAG: c-type cytochrome [Sphingomonadaceae bacterium]
MDDRFNTIAGWVLGAGIVALGSSIFVHELYDSERPEKMGYVVEGVELEGDGEEEAEQPISFFLASTDAAAGENVFKKCAACHTIEQGGADGLGPNLWGMMGAPVAGGSFPYSEALESVGGSWDWETMSEWLKSPSGFAPGTKMTFAGISSPEDRAAVMLYMNEMSASPLPVPPPPAADTAEQAAAEKADAEAARGEDEPVLDVEDAAAQPEGNIEGAAAPKRRE